MKDMISKHLMILFDRFNLIVLNPDLLEDMHVKFIICLYLFCPENEFKKMKIGIQRSTKLGNEKGKLLSDLDLFIVLGAIFSLGKDFSIRNDDFNTIHGGESHTNLKAAITQILSSLSPNQYSSQQQIWIYYAMYTFDEHECTPEIYTFTKTSLSTSPAHFTLSHHQRKFLSHHRLYYKVNTATNLQLENLNEQYLEWLINNHLLLKPLWWTQSAFTELKFILDAIYNFIDDVEISSSPFHAPLDGFQSLESSANTKSFFRKCSLIWNIIPRFSVIVREMLCFREKTSEKCSSIHLYGASEQISVDFLCKLIEWCTENYSAIGKYAEQSKIIQRNNFFVDSLTALKNLMIRTIDSDYEAKVVCAKVLKWQWATFNHFKSRKLNTRILSDLIQSTLTNKSIPSEDYFHTLIEFLTLLIEIISFFESGDGDDKDEEILDDCVLFLKEKIAEILEFVNGSSSGTGEWNEDSFISFLLSLPKQHFSHKECDSEGSDGWDLILKCLAVIVSEIGKLKICLFFCEGNFDIIKRNLNKVTLNTSSPQCKKMLREYPIVVPKAPENIQSPEIDHLDSVFKWLTLNSESTFDFMQDLKYFCRHIYKRDGQEGEDGNGKFLLGDLKDLKSKLFKLSLEYLHSKNGFKFIDHADCKLRVERDTEGILDFIVDDKNGGETALDNETECCQWYIMAKEILIALYSPSLTINTAEIPTRIIQKHQKQKRAQAGDFILIILYATLITNNNPQYRQSYLDMLCLLNAWEYTIINAFITLFIDSFLFSFGEKESSLIERIKNKCSSGLCFNLDFSFNKGKGKSIHDHLKENSQRLENALIEGLCRGDNSNQSLFLNSMQFTVSIAKVLIKLSNKKQAKSPYHNTLASEKWSLINENCLTNKARGDSDQSVLFTQKCEFYRKLMEMHKNDEQSLIGDAIICCLNPANNDTNFESFMFIEALLVDYDGTIEFFLRNFDSLTCTDFNALIHSIKSVDRLGNVGNNRRLCDHKEREFDNSLFTANFWDSDPIAIIYAAESMAIPPRLLAHAYAQSLTVYHQISTPPTLSFLCNQKVGKGVIEKIDNSMLLLGKWDCDDIVDGCFDFESLKMMDEGEGGDHCPSSPFNNYYLDTLYLKYRPFFITNAPNNISYNTDNNTTTSSASNINNNIQEKHRQRLEKCLQLQLAANQSLIKKEEKINELILIKEEFYDRYIFDDHDDGGGDAIGLGNCGAEKDVGLKQTLEFIQLLSHLCPPLHTLSLSQFLYNHNPSDSLPSLDLIQSSIASNSKKGQNQPQALDVRIRLWSANVFWREHHMSAQRIKAEILDGIEMGIIDSSPLDTSANGEESSAKRLKSPKMNTASTIDAKWKSNVYNAMGRFWDDQLCCPIRAAQIEHRKRLLAADKDADDKENDKEAKNILSTSSKSEASKELERLLKEQQQSALHTCLNYARALGFSDDHNITINRVVSIWFSSCFRDCIPAALILGIAKHKFIPLIHQLVKRVSEGDAKVGQLVALILKECPHSCVFPLLSHLNGSGGGGDEDDAKSRNLIKECLQIGHSHSSQLALIIAETRRLWRAYRQLADLDELDPSDCDTKKLYPFSVSAPLIKGIRSLSIPIPTLTHHQAGGGDAVTCASFTNGYRVVGGINLPKIVECVGSDGRTYRQLVKGKDNVRLDAVMEQVFLLVNRLIIPAPTTTRAKTTNARPGKITKLDTFRVIPLGDKGGVMEWVEGSVPLGDWLTKAHPHYHPQDMTPKRARQLMRTEHCSPTTTPATKLSLYRQLTTSLTPVLRHFFTSQSEGIDEWWRMRTNYLGSLAISSIVGWLVGLGDRHLQNILLDRRSGRLILIDLNMIFDRGQKLRVPERVPFRFTPNIRDGLGMNGHKVLLREASTLFASLRISQSLFLMILRSIDPDEEKEVTPNTKTNANKPATITAIERVKEKLVSGGVASMGVVSDLFSVASDDVLLSQMYHGWQSWL